mmetsp:Transcript_107690/g.337280  ORF Transcript_107690/g.337280 Transcript_107690/m.337280 type:complete len:267 (-) Transcript_107690:1063-1863(-)
MRTEELGRRSLSASSRKRGTRTLLPQPGAPCTQVTRLLEIRFRMVSRCASIGISSRCCSGCGFPLASFPDSAGNFSMPSGTWAASAPTQSPFSFARERSSERRVASELSDSIASGGASSPPSLKAPAVKKATKMRPLPNTAFGSSSRSVGAGLFLGSSGGFSSSVRSKPSTLARSASDCMAAWNTAASCAHRSGTAKPRGGWSVRSARRSACWRTSVSLFATTGAHLPRGESGSPMPADRIVTQSRESISCGRRRGPSGRRFIERM